MMCAHREHRTGNCRECELEQVVVEMPQLWDGDQA